MTAVAIVLLVVKLSIALNVFALGLAATPSDAVYLLRRPRELGRALLSMNVIMPVTAYLLIRRFDLDPAVKIALVALAISPVPPFFPKKAMKAQGHENYAVGILVATAALAIVLVPIGLGVFEHLRDSTLHVPVKQIVGLMFLTVLLPLFAGIAVHALSPSFADRAVKPIGTFALLLLIASALPIIVKVARDIPPLIGNGTLLAMAIFAFVGFLSGHVLGGPDPDNRHTLALATASRHPAIALAIAHANFPREPLTAPAIVLYFLASGVLALIYNRLESSPRHSAAKPPMSGGASATPIRH
jgi:BASS family bile acid:Na+ symporter